MFPAQAVEIEAAESEDGVVEEMLVSNCELGNGVAFHDAVVVGAAQRLEKSMRYREKGHMLDVWIMFGGVGHDVVDVVVPFPPAEAESAEEVGDYDSNYGVVGEIVRYAHMSCIVGREDQLVPKKAEKEPGETVPLKVKAYKTHGKEEKISGNLKHVCAVVALVEALHLDSGMELTVALCYGILRGGVQGRISGEVKIYLLSSISIYMRRILLVARLRHII